MKKALIAMSGGVDSSVAAYLMMQQGFDCIGATMHLYDNEDAGIPRERTCCSLSDVEDARFVASRIGMPFYVLNFKEEFSEQVIAHFVSEYEHARTPNPCIDCNRFLKFGKLDQRAKELSCDVVVTGHYARIEKTSAYGEARFVLKKGLDASKDQSYVLYAMTQEQLARTVFPLGGMTKQEVRSIAEAQGFVNATKRDSQDICFVPDGDYAKAICRFSQRTYPPGNFIGPDGAVLGTHKGIIHYTVGQRRGLGLSLKESLYVHHVDIEKNEVHLCRDADLYTSELDACDVNWIAYDADADGASLPAELRVFAKVRYSAKETKATAYPAGADRLHLVFDEPVRAITKGQAVVLYDGDTVIGGGTIC